MSKESQVCTVHSAIEKRIAREFYPRPLQDPLPIWVGVGGTPSSFVRAGTLGRPLIVVIIGGEPKRFRTLIDLYSEAGRRAGHSEEKLIVGLHAIGFLGNTKEQAAGDFYPGYARAFTKIGKERNWPPATRAQFDALRGPTGALLIGDAETVGRKVPFVIEVLGGLSRITFQMGFLRYRMTRCCARSSFWGPAPLQSLAKSFRALDRSPGTAMPAQFSNDPPRHVGQR